jgi:2-keto-3-deoxy-L-fuconate dehydrogenase
MRAALPTLRAIVTGAASGIGAATSARLIEESVDVAVLDLQPPVDHAGPYAIADLGDDSSVRQAVAKLTRDLGGLDILVNNAGIGAAGTVEDNDDDEWHRIWDVNVVGTVRVTRAALPELRRSDNASIVNTSSIVATIGLPKRALYSATKGAILSLTRAMAADLLPDGIRVNAVLPGTTDTPWIGRLLAAADHPDQEREALRARQPHSRLVTPAEVANAIAFLALPGVGSITGAAVTVDGGLTNIQLRRDG